MISDVLSEAVAEIDRYLSAPEFTDLYADELRARIVTLRSDMDAMRAMLDTPPAPEVQS